MEDGKEEAVPVPPTGSVNALTAMLAALESVDLWRRVREGWGRGWRNECLDSSSDKEKKCMGKER